jgi:hypothetical protein
MEQVSSEVCNYEIAHTLIDLMATSAAKTNNNIIPFKDVFLNELNQINCTEQLKPTDQQNLIIALAETYVAKATSNTNPVFTQRF